MHRHSAVPYRPYSVASGLCCAARILYPQDQCRQPAVPREPAGSIFSVPAIPPPALSVRVQQEVLMRICFLFDSRNDE